MKFSTETEKVKMFKQYYILDKVKGFNIDYHLSLKRNKSLLINFSFGKKVSNIRFKTFGCGQDLKGKFTAYFSCIISTR